MISNRNDNETAEQSTENTKNADDDNNSIGSERSRGGTSYHHLGAPLSFPLQMMEILSNEDNVDVIHWLPHGKGFMVADKKRFAREIMPKYFSRSSKYTSFTRKLNRW